MANSLKKDLIKASNIYRKNSESVENNYTNSKKNSEKYTDGVDAYKNEKNNFVKRTAV